MAKKNRVHVNFRIAPETYKQIKKLARREGYSEGVAVDCFVASCAIKESQLQYMEEELKKFTKIYPTYEGGEKHNA